MMGYRCPKCGEGLDVGFVPTNIAKCILNYTLKEVLELQTALATQGVILEFHTAEIQFIDTQPSLGKE